MNQIEKDKIYENMRDLDIEELCEELANIYDEDRFWILYEALEKNISKEAWQKLKNYFVEIAAEKKIEELENISTFKRHSKISYV